MLDWLLKHPVMIFLIIAVVSSLFKKLKPELDEEKPAPPPDPRALQRDFQEIERTRHIQEEIRRKIAERRGAATPVAAPSLVRPVAPAPVVVVRHQSEEPPVYEPEKWMDEAVLERQRVLAEQMAALQARRTAVNREAQAVRAPDAKTTVAAKPLRELSLLQNLRNARSLREAIILREVLGPPVALR